MKLRNEKQIPSLVKVIRSLRDDSYAHACYNVVVKYIKDTFRIDIAAGNYLWHAMHNEKYKRLSDLEFINVVIQVARVLEVELRCNFQYKHKEWYVCHYQEYHDMDQPLMGEFGVEFDSEGCATKCDPKCFYIKAEHKPKQRKLI